MQSIRTRLQAISFALSVSTAICTAPFTTGCGGNGVNTRSSALDGSVVDPARTKVVTTLDATDGVDAGDQADGRVALRPIDTRDGSAPTADASAPSQMEAGAAMEAGSAMMEAGYPEGSMAQVCGLSDCAPGAPCADLVPDSDGLSSSIIIDTETFPSTSCAIVEGCLPEAGTRKLLRFETGIINMGTADLVVGGVSGDPCFSYSQCHMHFHFLGAGAYTLYQMDGKTVAAQGHKQGFCIDDTEPYVELDPQPPAPATPFDCNNQGLHVGYEDIYPNDIDCQWIDITDVPSGQYILSVDVNVGHYLPESNFDNNNARVPVTIP